MSTLVTQLFPACAGMNRDRPGKAHLMGAVPRVRGDEPAGRRIRKSFAACSPRARG